MAPTMSKTGPQTAALRLANWLSVKLELPLELVTGVLTDVTGVPVETGSGVGLAENEMTPFVMVIGTCARNEPVWVSVAIIVPVEIVRLAGRWIVPLIMPFAFETGAGSSKGIVDIVLERTSFTAVPFGSQFEPLKAMLPVSPVKPAVEVAVGASVAVDEAVTVGEAVGVAVLLLVPFGRVNIRVGAPAVFCPCAASTV